jgi:hypothetical protein
MELMQKPSKQLSQNIFNDETTPEHNLFVLTVFGSQFIHNGIDRR